MIVLFEGKTKMSDQYKYACPESNKQLKWNTKSQLKTLGHTNENMCPPRAKNCNKSCPFFLLYICICKLLCIVNYFVSYCILLCLITIVKINNIYYKSL